MRKFALLSIFLICCCSAFAKEAEPKTFLVIFKSKELKNLKLTLHEIETQFAEYFKTKAYSGNSELALLIDIPACEFDECYLGQLLVESSSGIQHKLQDIAFRLFDMTQSQKTLNLFLTAYDQSIQKRKASKTDRASPIP
jgi:hypothetical protein